MTHHGNDEGDWGERDLDPAEQAEAERNLDEPSATADEPWSPPDRQPRHSELIGEETDGGETLDQRIQQEQPEVGTAYGAPDGHADQDVLGGPAGADRPVSADGPEASAMRVVEEPEP